MTTLDEKKRIASEKRKATREKTRQREAEEKARADRLKLAWGRIGSGYWVSAEPIPPLAVADFCLALDELRSAVESLRLECDW